MIAHIYEIKNIKNGNRYIGSSIEIEKRFRAHKYKLRMKKHHSKYLQNAWNKYGEKSFKFRIIKKCKKIDALKVEQFYLDKYNPEYNISKNSSAPMAGRKHSKETIQKFKGRKGVRGKNHHFYGKKLTKEHIAKLIKSRKGYKHSEETKLKMSKTNKTLKRYLDILPSIEANKKKVIDSLGNKFNSMVECAKFHQISVQTVCDILKGHHYKTRKKINFKYA